VAAFWTFKSLTTLGASRDELGSFRTYSACSLESDSDFLIEAGASLSKTEAPLRAVR